MGSESLTADVKAAALQVGFDLAAIAPAVSPPGFAPLQKWIEQGFAGDMHYLPRREAAYSHPRHVMDTVRSVIMVALNYKTVDPPNPAPNQGHVARYAWGEADYHAILKERLQKLSDWLHERCPGCRTRAAVDTAPILERDFARLAGLGWFGKNTMLINKRAGSFLFLGALLTDLDLEPDPPHDASHCGTCTRCLDACPTDAFPEPYVLDARKCIAYLTIETKGPMPVELRTGVGEWLFGCDLCQDVCPWNRKSPRSRDPVFQPKSDLAPADAISLLQITESEFHLRFRDSPLSRPGWNGIRRNAAIVLGNMGNTSAVPALIAALNEETAVLRGAAAWALGRIGGEKAFAALQSRRDVEDNPDVIEELNRALEAQGDP